MPKEMLDINAPKSLEMRVQLTPAGKDVVYIDIDGVTLIRITSPSEIIIVDNRRSKKKLPTTKEADKRLLADIQAGKRIDPPMR